MKMLFSVLILSFALSATANAVCYQLSSQQAPKELPKTLCLEAAQVNFDRATIQASTSTSKRYFGNLDLTYFGRHNENGFSFRSKMTVFERSLGTCEESESFVLHVNGKTDNEGIVETTILDIRVEHTYLLDSCHSEPQIMGTYLYKLK